VEDLFFNTPVRRKFLRSREAEQAAIIEAVRHLALGFPEVHFVLKAGNKTLLAAPAPQSLLERVGSLYGPELAGRLLPLAAAAGPLTVTGLISAPDFTLASSRLQLLLVNRRPVQDRLLGAVLKAVYQGLTTRGRHPAAFVHLTLPPEEVDVNVHPAKVEIRLHDAGRVYALLVAAMRQGLGGLAPEPPRYTVRLIPEAAARMQEAHPVGAFASRRADLPVSLSLDSPRSASPDRPLFPQTWRFQDLQIIGQLQNTYILAQAPGGLILIDQHAAHERVLFESLSGQGGAGPRQQLLFPQVVEVKPQEAEWLRANLALVAQAGVELEPFGGASFLVRAAPACLAQADLEALLLEMVEDLAPLQKHGDSQRLAEATRLLLACHGAIRAGQILNREEIQALLMQLDELAVSSHCPHGRPLWRLIPFADIRQSFRRPRD
jgi:DNA mismatch repair protein MutL